MQVLKTLKFEIEPRPAGVAMLRVELVNGRQGVAGEVSAEELGNLILYLEAKKKQVQETNLKGDANGSKTI